MQNGGGPPFFMHGLKGGGIKKYANVLPAKMLKAATGCHQQIQPIKIALYNTYNIDLISTVNITSTIIIVVVVLSI